MILGGGVCKHQIANAMLFVCIKFILTGRIHSIPAYSATAQIFLCISYVQSLVRGLPGAHGYLQNTGQEFDGSDSGARPDEAVSWGKIRAGAETVKVGNIVRCAVLTNAHLSAGLCGRDACVPVNCRCDVCSSYTITLGVNTPVGSGS
jgi:hypothetical protein